MDRQWRDTAIQVRAISGEPTNVPSGFRFHEPVRIMPDLRCRPRDAGLVGGSDSGSCQIALTHPRAESDVQINSSLSLDTLYLQVIRSMFQE